MITIIIITIIIIIIIIIIKALYRVWTSSR